MKISSTLLLFFLASIHLHGQSVQKQNNEIIYMMPENIIALLEKNVGPVDNDYFYLTLQSDQYTIYALKIDSSAREYNWLKNTTRAVFINHKLYPLLFDLDFTFSARKKSDKPAPALKSADYCVSFKEDGAIMGVPGGIQ